MGISLVAPGSCGTIGLDLSCTVRQTAPSLDQRYFSACVVSSFSCGASSFNTLFFSVMQYFIFSGFLYSYTICVAYGSSLALDHLEAKCIGISEA